MAEQLQDLSKVSGFISILEKAHETKTALLLFSFLMFLDSEMTSFGPYGLYDLCVNSEIIRISLIPTIILTFVFFSLIMSILTPIFTEGVRQMFLTLFHSIWFRLSYDEDRVPSLWRAGYVSSYKISRAAHMRKDDYLLDLAKDAKEQENDSRDSRYRLLLLGVSCVVFSSYNLFNSHAKSTSLLRHIEQLVPGSAWLLIGLLLCLSIWLSVGNNDTYVYCPSLAKEQTDEIDKNNEEIRSFCNKSGLI